jgi:hypothetical protein
VVFRRKKDPVASIDVSAVTGEWRRSVHEAMQARARYAEVLGTVPKGPLRDRIAEIGSVVDAGVLSSWELAQRGAQGEKMLAALDPEGTTARFKDAKRRFPDGGPEVDALQAQHEAVNKLWDGVDSSREQLKLLDLRLGAAVARVAALAITARAPGDLDPAAAELTTVVDELGALSRAFDDLA